MRITFLSGTTQPTTMVKIHPLIRPPQLGRVGRAPGAQQPRTYTKVVPQKLQRTTQPAHLGELPQKHTHTYASKDTKIQNDQRIEALARILRKSLRRLAPPRVELTRGVWGRDSVKVSLLEHPIPNVPSHQHCMRICCIDSSAWLQRGR